MARPCRGFALESSRPVPETIEIHGFRVVALGTITSGFRSALARLARRGFSDPACTVVKTSPGPSSGITHWGGRYVHAANPVASEAVAAMRELLPEPPSPPFLAVPGPCLLYHEWGHHVDRTWSRDDIDVAFSLRWVSRYYDVRRPRDPARAALLPSRPPGLHGSAEDWPAALPAWCLAASELFAGLFETWMRGADEMYVDVCDPWMVARSNGSFEPRLDVSFLPGADSERARRETFRLFEAGLRSMPEPPPVRPDLFGASTDRALRALRSALAQCRASAGIRPPGLG